MRFLNILSILALAVVGTAAPLNETPLNETTTLEARDDSPTTFCWAGKPDIVPAGSAFQWEIAVRGQDLGSTDKECAPWLKKRVKQQSACKAITNWKCKWDPKTKTNYATFFSDIFCGAKPMVTAVEAATSPKIKTSCINTSNKNLAGANPSGFALDVLKGAFQALGAPG